MASFRPGQSFVLQRGCGILQTWANSIFKDAETLRRIVATRGEVMDPETEAYRARLSRVDAEIAALRAETLDTLRNWLFETSLGFRVIFSIGLLLLASLWLDLLIP